MFNPLREMLNRYHRDPKNRSSDYHLVLKGEDQTKIIRTFIAPAIEGYETAEKLRKLNALQHIGADEAVGGFDRLCELTLTTAVKEYNDELDRQGD